MFTRILIANRGEIARRVAATCLKLGVETVAVYSEADADLPLLSEVTLAVPLKGNTARETYLNVEALLDVAEQSHCEAVHPGYGFLAESANFARRCAERGLVFIGPDPEHIELMGEKRAARDAFESVGFPVLGKLSLADVVSLDAGSFPIIVKASAGGGGIGMALVHSPAELAAAIDRVRSAGERYFGSGDVYAERFLIGASHVEVQIAGTSLGPIEAGERDCSWQRRYQKVVEETPSPNLRIETRESLLASAKEAVGKLGYSNVGTVECLVKDGLYFFLEMNTRIQVEHAITEAVRGIDLVEWQLLLSTGVDIPLQDVNKESHGHAIELRVYAEDPDTLRPSPGRIMELDIPSGEGIRVDTGYITGSTIPIFYDPLIAKIVIHAMDRTGAIKKAQEVLNATAIRGPKTNLTLLTKIVSSIAFQKGSYHTQSLDQLMDAASL